MDELRRTFRPEFLNRVDDIVIFHQLGRDGDRPHRRPAAGAAAQAAARARAGARARRPRRAPSSADRGYDPQYGARPLKRAIMRYVQDPLARRLLAGEFHAGRHHLSSAVAAADAHGDEELRRSPRKTEQADESRRRVMMMTPT